MAIERATARPETEPRRSGHLWRLGVRCVHLNGPIAPLSGSWTITAGRFNGSWVARAPREIVGKDGAI